MTIAELKSKLHQLQVAEDMAWQNYYVSVDRWHAGFITAEQLANHREDCEAFQARTKAAYDALQTAYTFAMLQNMDECTCSPIIDNTCPSCVEYIRRTQGDKIPF